MTSAQLERLNPTEALLPVVIGRIADAGTTTSRYHIIACRLLKLDLTQQLQEIFV